jgi:hypothetical protein
MELGLKRRKKAKTLEVNVFTRRSQNVSFTRPSNDGLSLATSTTVSYNAATAVLLLTVNTLCNGSLKHYAVLNCIMDMYLPTSYIKSVGRPEKFSRARWQLPRMRREIRH